MDHLRNLAGVNFLSACDSQIAKERVLAAKPPGKSTQLTALLEIGLALKNECVKQ